MSGFLDDLAFHLAGPTSQLVVLDKPLRYRANGTIYRAPAGFACDLASVPRIIRSVASDWRQTARAGVIHDLLYRWFERFGLSRQKCDALYYTMLRREGVGRIRANLQWAGVRAGGWRSWGRWRETPDIKKGPGPRQSRKSTASART